MSVQTQIDRIAANIAAALSAIAEKGVTVPDGSNSDALAELITSIQAGGGGLELWGRTQIMTGSFTLSDTMTTSYEIADVSSLIGDHSYNVVAFLWRDVSTRDNMHGLICGVVNALYYGSQNSSNTSASVGFGYTSSTGTSAIKYGGVSVTSNILMAKFTSTYNGYAGDTYNWLALAVKEV